MTIKEITSLQHPLVKHLVKLRQDKELRKETRTLLIVGRKTIRDLSEKLPVQILLTTEKESLDAEETIIATPEILKKITGLEEPDGIAAVFSWPKPQILEGKKRVLVLDRLQDPGNVGTLFRTALGLGWEGVILVQGSVDPFNDKVLRAAKGANMLLPFWEMRQEEIIALKRHMYIADAQGASLEGTTFRLPLLLILGSESTGPSPSFLKSGTKVSIPMSQEMESLNVAAAGSVLMYHLVKK